VLPRVLASTADAKSFTYVFEGIEFPYVPLLRPRLGLIEEWKFLKATNMLVKPIGTVVSVTGSQPNGLGGD